MLSEDMSKSIALAIADNLNENHISIFSYGSRARGDFSDDSDLDLIVICQSVTSETLEKVGEACIQQDVIYEVNPQVMTHNEITNYPEQMGVSKIIMEGKRLTGSFKLPKLNVNGCLNTSITLLNESLMSMRHYYLSGEISKLPNRKVNRYIIKPLLHGLRYHHFAKEGICKNNKELEVIYPDLVKGNYSGLAELSLRVMAFNKLLKTDA